MFVGMRHTAVLVLGLVLLAVACGFTPAEEYLLKGNDYYNTGDYERLYKSTTRPSASTHS